LLSLPSPEGLPGFLLGHPPFPLPMHFTSFPPHAYLLLIALCAPVLGYVQLLPLCFAVSRHLVLSNDSFFS
jgi:hypothetical protein